MVFGTVTLPTKGESNDETPLFNFYEATKGRGWIKTDQLNLESK